MVDQIHYLTPEGMQDLESRLKNLIEVRRPKVTERLRVAMEEAGDLAENAEYVDAMDEQAFIEGEITRLEIILNGAQVIESTGNTDTVQLGSRVTVVEKGTDLEEVYHIVGSAEANPREGRISHSSPLGQALIGAKLKKKVKVEAPDGEIVFIITAIQ